MKPIIFSASGVAEEGCVFTSNQPHEGPAVWICSRYEPQNHLIEFMKVITGKAVVHLKLHVKANGAQTAALEMTCTATGLNDPGNQFVAHYMEHAPAMLGQLFEKGLNHYLTTGAMLRGNHGN